MSVTSKLTTLAAAGGGGGAYWYVVVDDSQSTSFNNVIVASDDTVVCGGFRGNFNNLQMVTFDVNGSMDIEKIFSVSGFYLRGFGGIGLSINSSDNIAVSTTFVSTGGGINRKGAFVVDKALVRKTTSNKFMYKSASVKNTSSDFDTPVTAIDNNNFFYYWILASDSSDTPFVNRTDFDSSGSTAFRGRFSSPFGPTVPMSIISNTKFLVCGINRDDVRNELICVNPTVLSATSNQNTVWKTNLQFQSSSAFYVRHVISEPDGNSYGVGSYMSDSQNKVGIFKISNSGSFAYKKYFSLSGISGGYADGVAFDADGNLFYLGHDSSKNNVLVKFDTSGDMLWSRKIAPTGIYNKSDVNNTYRTSGLSIDSVGDIYIATTWSTGALGEKSILLKYPNDGSLSGTLTNVTITELSTSSGTDASSGNTTQEFDVWNDAANTDNVSSADFSPTATLVSL